MGQVIFSTFQHFLQLHIGIKYLDTFDTAKLEQVNISGGPLSALTCCVNVRILSGDKKNIAVNLFSKLGWELGLY